MKGLPPTAKALAGFLGLQLDCWQWWQKEGFNSEQRSLVAQCCAGVRGGIYFGSCRISGINGKQKKTIQYCDGKSPKAVVVSVSLGSMIDLFPLLSGRASPTPLLPGRFARGLFCGDHVFYCLTSHCHVVVSIFFSSIPISHYNVL